MTWTSGKWSEVAIGDDVLGADGYAWRVTDAEKRYAPNGDEYRAVEMERDGRTPARASVLADKPVKYRANGFVDVGVVTEPTYTVAETCEAWGGCDEHPAPVVITESKPYVEYDDAERAAASALKGAGLAMTVIERQMTLDGLTQHIGAVHGEPLPGAGGNLTRIELRSRLADLHFQLHEKDQARGQRWEPRGSTAHVHPVMDRPMEDAEPKSLRAKR